MADASDLNVGKKVRWGYGDSNVYGKITKKETNGNKVISNAGGEKGEMLEGTEDNPAFRIKNYEYRDGSWKPSGDKTVHRADNLTVIDSWPENG